MDTLEELDNRNSHLIFEQNHSCAVCAEVFRDVPKVHRTPQGREVAALCMPCAKGLFAFGFNYDLVARAVEYLSTLEELEAPIDISK